MPSDRRCVLVRLSDDDLSLLDAAAQEWGVSRSSILSTIFEINRKHVRHFASLSPRRVKGQMSGFGVADASTTATNSQR
jgi:hypothetical protein